MLFGCILVKSAARCSAPIPSPTGRRKVPGQGLSGGKSLKQAECDGAPGPVLYTPGNSQVIRGKSERAKCRLPWESLEGPQQDRQGLHAPQHDKVSVVYSRLAKSWVPF